MQKTSGTYHCGVLSDLHLYDYILPEKRNFFEPGNILSWEDNYIYTEAKDIPLHREEYTQGLLGAGK